MNKREKRFLVTAIFGAILMASLGWAYAASGGNGVADAKAAVGGPGRLFACYVTYLRNGNLDAGACDILSSSQNLGGAGWGGSAGDIGGIGSSIGSGNSGATPP
jgi:hypothetical protein